MSMGFAENTCKYTLFFSFWQKNVTISKKHKKTKWQNHPLSVCCTLLVRYLYDDLSYKYRTSNVQITYNYRTIRLLFSLFSTFFIFKFFFVSLQFGLHPQKYILIRVNGWKCKCCGSVAMLLKNVKTHWQFIIGE